MIKYKTTKHIIYTPLYIGFIPFLLVGNLYVLFWSIVGFIVFPFIKNMTFKYWWKNTKDTFYNLWKPSIEFLEDL